MTAGAGILHKEYHEKEFSKKGGMMQMVQLWVNLPAKDKMTPPKYQAIENGMMGRVLLKDSKSTIEVIAGEYTGTKGPATTFSPVSLFNAKLIQGARAEFSFSSKSNTGMLVIEGEVRVNDSKTAPENNFIYFGHDQEEIVLEALKDSVILILSGDPLLEPIASYGPFVMNTQSEIKQAYEDFYSGKFGHLED
jgi:redox-sensitive bicupin YhaK (pirin superfamily)